MDKRKVIRSAGIVGLFVLISRALGLVRDMLMAAFFGTSLAMSAFVVAFTIPNLFRALFGEGAMSSAFVPVFTETREKFGSDSAWLLANRMFSALSSVLALLVLAGILIATVLLNAFPGSEQFAMILALLRIMLPYMFFICLTAFFSAILNSLHVFLLPAAAPVVLNLVLIITLAAVCPVLSADYYIRIKAVAWAVIVAGIIQCVMLLPGLAGKGLRLRFAIKRDDEGVRRVVRLMGIAFIGVGVTQLNVLLDRFIATLISPASPSYLYFAERLVYFPLGIFATALGTVLLPAFSGQAAMDRVDKMLNIFNQSVRHLMFVMMPAAAGLMALAHPIVRLIYERGDFTPHSTQMTALALMCYAPGLIMFSMLKALIPMFYARQDMKTPVRAGLISAGLNIALSLILMWPLRHAGIAVATVISASVHVVLLAVLAHRRIGPPAWNRIVPAVLRMACAAAVMSAAAIMTHRRLYDAAVEFGVTSRQIVALGGGIGIAVLVYAVAALAFRCAELPEIWRAATGRGR